MPMQQNLTTPQQLFYNDTIVITGNSLCDFYECSKDRIRKNFNKNKYRYKEGKHFFQLKGEKKRKYIKSYQIDESYIKAPSLHLWTDKGVILHAKCLNTNNAYLLLDLITEMGVFEALEHISKLPKKEYADSKNIEETYIMKDTIRGFYKIGKSKSVLSREKTLQAEIPSIELLLTFPFLIEKELHNFYKKKRLRGEWFKLNTKDLNFLHQQSLLNNKSHIIDNLC